MIFKADHYPWKDHHVEDVAELPEGRYLLSSKAAWKLARSFGTTPPPSGRVRRLTPGDSAYRVQLLRDAKTYYILKTRSIQP